MMGMSDDIDDRLDIPKSLCCSTSIRYDVSTL